MNRDLPRAMHLVSADLEPAGDRCPVCDAPGPRAPRARIQRAPDVDFLECPTCRGCSLSLLPTARFLEGYYQGAYAEAHVSTTTGNAERFARHIAAALALPRSAARPLTVLDFGGSDGSMAIGIARALLASGQATHVDLTVVDFVDLAQANDPRISTRRAAALDQLTSQYDLVLASAILEHIPRVNPVLRGLLRAIAPGGSFYARTPYSVPLKRLWSGYDTVFPAHVHDLGAPFWSRLDASFGFRGVVVKSQPSMVETRLRELPLRTTLAHLMKLPARVELALGLARGGASLHWPWVGGWEVVLRQA